LLFIVVDQNIKYHRINGPKSSRKDNTKSAQSDKMTESRMRDREATRFEISKLGRYPITQSDSTIPIP